MPDPAPGHRIDIRCDADHPRVRLPVSFYWEPDGPRWMLDTTRTWAPRGPRDGDGIPADTIRPSTDARKRGYRAEPGHPLVLLCPRCPREVPLTSQSVQYVCDKLHGIGVSAASLSLISRILERRSQVLS